jgi:uncharacterized protein
MPGGEGYLGRLLAYHFATCGHQVTTFTRRPFTPAAGQIERSKRALWDGRNLGPWTEVLEGSDVVINLSGRSVNCRYNAKDRDEILRSRIESTAILGKAIQTTHCPPRVWLNASTATIYRHTFDKQMGEMTGELGGDEPDTPESWRFSNRVAQEWERSFTECQTPLTRKVALRAAMVMSVQDGGVFPIILRLVRLGLGGAWGSGRNFMSWIHEADFLRAVDFLINQEEITGAVNLAAPNPLSNSEFMKALRKTWGIPFGFPASAWLLSVVAIFLRTETELLLKSRRVVPTVLQEHGFRFWFPEWPAAAENIVRRWKQASSLDPDQKLDLNLSGGDN